MRILDRLKTKKAQQTFEAALIIFVLLILPSLPLGKYGGGVAMVAGSVVGLIGWFVLYGERLRSRGQLKLAALLAAMSMVVAAALSLLLTRGHWH